ncbi:MAG TPA: hypothetical protein VNO26_06800 [Candidatus Limnocylindria bacterium]|nr:hypothetical protein [Candidatus Limnocylindria bacterium]
MYFVTVKRPGYVLFCLTPSERMAVGLTDDQRRVHVLERRGADWAVYREWPVDELSHTELMQRLASVDEPPSAEALVRIASGE